MASPARTARRAWSSCAMGAPNSAMTLSPRTWLTVPSCGGLPRPWLDGAAHESMYFLRVQTFERDVEPTISTNSTVTCLRSFQCTPLLRIFGQVLGRITLRSTGLIEVDSLPATRCPQAAQNCAVADSSLPQLGQARGRVCHTVRKVRADAIVAGSERTSCGIIGQRPK